MVHDYLMIALCRNASGKIESIDAELHLENTVSASAILHLLCYALGEVFNPYLVSVMFDLLNHMFWRERNNMFLFWGNDICKLTLRNQK